jgi:hypothetical protein
MRLKSVRIKNFRCIDDSTEFSIDDLTCLVGKNEAGKTALLQAIEKINPLGESHQEFDKRKDYPRKSLSDFDPEAECILSKWELDEGELDELRRKLGPKAVTGNPCTLTITYSSRRWSLDWNEKEIAPWLLSECKCTKSEKAAIGEAPTLAEMAEQARGINQKLKSENLKNLISKIEEFPNGKPFAWVAEFLEDGLPSFLYFSNYDRMSGEVSIADISHRISTKNLRKSDEVFLAFLDYSGTSVEELATLRRAEDTFAKVESASIKITDRLLRYWSQNKHLSVSFRVDAGQADDPPPFNTGNVMRARIMNELHRMTVSFSERSAGFVWFFSFLVYFAQLSKRNPNLIILLDEPGLSLHAKAQGDLLRFFVAELLPNHQLIYSTHSPFMVPPDKLSSVRTVEDVVLTEGRQRPEVLGTKVGDKVFSTDRDTLFPLQGALGYEITQSLFVGKGTLLVEGPSDVLYLTAFSNELKRRKRTGLDARWTICPSGGLDKVNAFVSLFHGNHSNVAILTDSASPQKNRIENLKKTKILEEVKVFSAGDICNQDEADIEDIIGLDLYLNIVNAFYESGGYKAVTKKAMSESGETSARIVKRIEAALRILPDRPLLDHFAPASFLIQYPELIQGSDADEALARFELLFRKLNSLAT